MPRRGEAGGGADRGGVRHDVFAAVRDGGAGDAAASGDVSADVSAVSCGVVDRGVCPACGVRAGGGDAGDVVGAGEEAPANPWGGATLEWTCASPPPHDNFKKPPTVGDPYDHEDLVWDEGEQGYVRRKRNIEALSH